MSGRGSWLHDLDSTEVQTLRFTRVLFGLTPIPTWRSPRATPEPLERPTSREWRRFCGLYVDDLISGGPTVNESRDLKCDAITIFADGEFPLHKWHSNEPELETKSQAQPADGDGETAKFQLGSTPGEGCNSLVLGGTKLQTH